MAGYSYYHVSMRSQISGGQPFAHFVPSQFNRNDPTKKKIVPVTSRPYHDSDDDDDGEWNQQRQTSPPRGHPSNSHGDYISNKESIGSTINKPDGYDNGISYGRKEGTKPSFVGAIKNDNHDGYNNGYGGRKQTESSTLRPNNKYDATNYGYANYGGGNKEGRNPIETSVKKDNYGEYENPAKKDNNDGYGVRYGNLTKKNNYGAYGGYGNPAKNDNYDGYAGYENPVTKDNYGTYGNPVKDNYSAHGNPLKEDDDGIYGNPVKKDNYGAYRGYGSLAKKDNYEGYDDYKEGPKSKPKPNSSPIYNSGYGHEKPLGTPIKGNTKLSKPTNDIDEAIEFLKEEAANRGYNEWHKQPKYEADNNPHQRIYDGSGPLPRRPMQADKKGMDLVNETEKLKKINVPLIKDNRPHSNFSDGKSSNSGVINHIEAEKRFNGMTI